MVRKRRQTVGEQRAEAESRRYAEWLSFEEALSKATTIAEAFRIVGQCPPDGTPGREFYSNLGCFLQHLQSLTVPRDANADELRLYQGLIARTAREMDSIPTSDLLDKLQAAEADRMRRP